MAGGNPQAKRGLGWWAATRKQNWCAGQDETANRYLIEIALQDSLSPSS